MLQVDVKDTEVAAQKAQQLAHVAEEMEAMVANLEQAAESVIELNHTMHLNEQVHRYLVEVSGNLKQVIPGITDVSQNLNNAVASMQEMEALNAQNMLGNL